MNAGFRFLTAKSVRSFREPQQETIMEEEEDTEPAFSATGVLDILGITTQPPPPQVADDIPGLEEVPQDFLNVPAVTEATAAAPAAAPAVNITKVDESQFNVVLPEVKEALVGESLPPVPASEVKEITVGPAAPVSDVKEVVVGAPVSEVKEIAVGASAPLPPATDFALPPVALPLAAPVALPQAASAESDVKVVTIN